MSYTITPEERAAIRSPSERWDALWYPHDRCHKMMLRLLTALEAAEAALLKEEVYSEELESQLQHTNAENARLQEENAILTGYCEVELPHLQSKNAALRAERDWLAGQLHGLGQKYNDVICPQEKCHTTCDCIDCWKEAARRAVAAESEVGE